MMKKTEKWLLQKGDHVIVLSGAYRDIKGDILSVNKKKGTVIVSNVNMVKKHKKGQNEPGSIVSMEAPVHKSNVALFDASINSASKVGVKFVERDGRKKKVRFFKKSGLEVRS